ncbi:STAS-like domain-containing protein [Stenotrophomonas maltophilia]|uniref:STAS-like domain-containing protein n=1 Tax=Stenotrophomonas maltophilia TaxID=40324 RepID=UPI0018C8B756|nr:STAS-like domain-containing protein [Stenotrophomonas maltophilia]
MSGLTVINIGKDYSRFPAGRYLDDGNSNGQRFRDEFLIPALVAGNKLKVLFDDALGYGSSFLEEAFGGLVRAGYNQKQLDSSLELVTSDESMKLEIWQYISDAQRELGSAK